jgi:methylglutamate dehydrogenase subunit D
VADIAVAALSAFSGLARPGRHGRTTGTAGLTVVEMTGLSLATVIARKGKAGDVAAAVQARFGLELPGAPTRTAADGVAFAWAGPGQWLATAEASRAGGFVRDLSQALSGLASVVEQSDGRGVLRLSGPAARDVLARGVPVDLHPRALRPGDTALTVCSHVDVQLWLLDEEPTFELVTARSSCGSLWHWLEETAAPYGMAVLPPA